MAFQNYALYPHMTAFDNIASPLRSRHVKAAEVSARVNETARMLRIDHVLSHLPKALSGRAKKQRTALARSLVARPSARRSGATTRCAKRRRDRLGLVGPGKWLFSPANAAAAKTENAKARTVAGMTLRMVPPSSSGASLAVLTDGAMNSNSAKKPRPRAYAIPVPGASTSALRRSASAGVAGL